ncbi:hypothetical protein [Colwellia sp. BRX8-9]|uniref:hypothetical protein n=1 Tax=Colwellia sp. BRX8-9 TaxID=2759831 RepID=UPI0015F36CC4|nr:hypothetical protein [Colwellia sp. BRX8-9]MBA6347968.1 hypothetical protein [Colwellia sp. BRX8-9]
MKARHTAVVEINKALALQQVVQYKCHRPEITLLYQLVNQYFSVFEEALTEQDKRLPKYVVREFDNFLCYGRLRAWL